MSDFCVLIAGDERVKDIQLKGDYFKLCKQEVIWDKEIGTLQIISLIDKDFNNRSPQKLPDVVIIFSLLYDLVYYKPRIQDKGRMELITKYEAGPTYHKKLESIVQLMVVASNKWAAQYPYTNFLWCLPYLPNFKVYNQCLNNFQSPDDKSTNLSIHRFLVNLSKIQECVEKFSIKSPNLKVMDLNSFVFKDQEELKRIVQDKTCVNIKWPEKLTKDGLNPTETFNYNFSIYLKENSILLSVPNDKTWTKDADISINEVKISPKTTDSVEKSSNETSTSELTSPVPSTNNSINQENNALISSSSLSDEPNLDNSDSTNKQGTLEVQSNGSKNINKAQISQNKESFEEHSSEMPLINELNPVIRDNILSVPQSISNTVPIVTSTDKESIALPTNTNLIVIQSSDTVLNDTAVLTNLLENSDDKTPSINLKLTKDSQINQLSNDLSKNRDDKEPTTKDLEDYNKEKLIIQHPRGPVLNVNDIPFPNVTNKGSINDSQPNQLSNFCPVDDLSTNKDQRELVSQTSQVHANQKTIFQQTTGQFFNISDIPLPGESVNDVVNDKFTSNKSKQSYDTSADPTTDKDSRPKPIKTVRDDAEPIKNFEISLPDRNADPSEEQSNQSVVKDFQNSDDHYPPSDAPGFIDNSSLIEFNNSIILNATESLSNTKSYQCQGNKERNEISNNNINDSLLNTFNKTPPIPKMLPNPLIKKQLNSLSKSPILKSSHSKPHTNPQGSVDKQSSDTTTKTTKSTTTDRVEMNSNNDYKIPENKQVNKSISIRLTSSASTPPFINKQTSSVRVNSNMINVLPKQRANIHPFSDNLENENIKPCDSSQASKPQVFKNTTETDKTKGVFTSKHFTTVSNTTTVSHKSSRAENILPKSKSISININSTTSNYSTKNLNTLSVSQKSTGTVLPNSKTVSVSPQPIVPNLANVDKSKTHLTVDSNTQKSFETRLGLPKRATADVSPQPTTKAEVSQSSAGSELTVNVNPTPKSPDLNVPKLVSPKSSSNLKLTSSPFKVS